MAAVGARNVAKSAKPGASRQVAEYLYRNIAGKKWPVGGKVPSENALTRELGVSRVSVRLAIQQFITLGVLESVRGKGTFLRTDNLDVLGGGASGIGEGECRDLAKVLQFRSLLEPEACFLAAERDDAGLTERLGRQLHLQVSSIGDTEEFVRHDILFHLAISEGCGNPLIHAALREVFGQTRRDHQRINAIFGYKDGVYYHTLILKAFENHDPGLARKLMAEHLEQAIALLVKNA
ncbi:MAG: FCD domain-containing protein [Planctomycetota bacterium]|jgi:GntR family transcriptional repressor for pyruvate dehydrogenase complex|nr:FCD domain-containing protein [Planctomycetota bacterium]